MAKRCADCHCILDDKNYADGINTAAFCQNCWNARCDYSDNHPISITCQKCGMDLYQNENDLWCFVCPIHGNVASLKSVFCN